MKSNVLGALGLYLPLSDWPKLQSLHVTQKAVFLPASPSHCADYNITCSPLD